MKRHLLIITFIAGSASVSAGSLTFSQGGKSKEEYKNHRCVDGIFAAGALKAQLTSEEVCRYGKQGCSSIEVKEKLTAYCGLPTLSECFEKKSWLAIDQILGVSLREEPGLITYGLKKGSVHERKTCAFWG